MRQVGHTRGDVGNFASDHGVGIRLGVHGRATCLLTNIRAILDAADHDNVFAC